MTPSVVLGILELVMTSFDLGGRRPTLYSGDHSPAPGDHSCQVSILWDVNCGHDAGSYTVTESCNYILRFSVLPINKLFASVQPKS